MRPIFLPCGVGIQAGHHQNLGGGGGGGSCNQYGLTKECHHLNRDLMQASFRCLCTYPPAKTDGPASFLGVGMENQGTLTFHEARGKGEALGRPAPHDALEL